MERERGTVTISQLEHDLHQVSARGELDVDERVQGHDAATRRAHELAEQLGGSAYKAADEWPMFSHRHRQS
jgi:ribosomal protein L15